jgi:hypothetical protein
VACAFGCALLSYFLIERAFLGLRKRLERTTSLPTRSRGMTELAHETKGGTAAAMPPSEPT